MRLTALVHNAQSGAVAYAETPDVLGLLAWLLRDQLLAKINAGFDEIADDKVALSQAQREEAEARIRADMLATERSECSLIWIAESRGEVIDFGSTTTPMAVLGRSTPNHIACSSAGTSVEHGHDIVGRTTMTPIVQPRRLACLLPPGMHGRGTSPRLYRERAKWINPDFTACACTAALSGFFVLSQTFDGPLR